jgi:hypothetical protein
LTDDTRRDLGKQRQEKGAYKTCLARLALAERRLEAVVRVLRAQCVRRRGVCSGDGDEEDKNEDEDTEA